MDVWGVRREKFEEYKTRKSGQKTMRWTLWNEFRIDIGVLGEHLEMSMCCIGVFNKEVAMLTQMSFSSFLHCPTACTIGSWIVCSGSTKGSFVWVQKHSITLNKTEWPPILLTAQSAHRIMLNHLYDNSIWHPSCQLGGRIIILNSFLHGGGRSDISSLE